eukprot:SAG31_NODE_481_length_15082_cov_13.818728_2_plen_417_part_00
MKLLDLSSQSQTDCEALQQSPELTICLMSGNAIQQLGPLPACRQLRKIDLSDNKIDSLPNAAMWSNLVHLEVLHLHTNNIQSLDNAKELASLPRLSILSLYRNPIALHPFYRAQLVKAMVHTLRWVSVRILANQIFESLVFKAWCHCFRVMDHFVLSLEETLDEREQDHEYHFGDTFGAFSKNLRFQPEEPLTGRFVEHRDLLNAEVALARSLYLKYNPAAMIQRVWRGRCVRVHLYKSRAARRMQGITRGFLVRRRKALGLDPIKARSMRMPAGFLQNVEWRVYFSHERTDLMKDLVLRVVKKSLVGSRDAEATVAGLIAFKWSDYYVIRSLEQGMEWSHIDDVTGVETSTKWVTGGVARRTKSDAAKLCSTRVLHLRLPGRPETSPILRRRPLNLLLHLKASDMIGNFTSALSA